MRVIEFAPPLIAFLGTSCVVARDWASCPLTWDLQASSYCCLLQFLPAIRQALQCQPRGQRGCVHCCPALALWMMYGGRGVLWRSAWCSCAVSARARVNAQVHARWASQVASVRSSLVTQRRVGLLGSIHFSGRCINVAWTGRCSVTYSKPQVAWQHPHLLPLAAREGELWPASGLDSMIHLINHDVKTCLWGLGLYPIIGCPQTSGW